MRVSAGEREEGEEVVLFLYRAAAWTGLRTTVGVAAGKFTVGPGRVENALANEGLFKNVAIGQGLATANDDRILGTEVGAVNPDDFLSLVRRAVTQNWVESCQMWKTDEGMPNCGHGPRRPVRRSRPGTTLYPGATTQQGADPCADARDLAERAPVEGPPVGFGLQGVGGARAEAADGGSTGC